VLELTPEEKYFYLYLISNCDYKKILYCETTKELMIINWIKYNLPNNPNTIKCVQKEINKVKNKAYIKILFNKSKETLLDVDKIFENYKFEESYENIIKNIENKKMGK
jgi:hypothetical protein